MGVSLGELVLIAVVVALFIRPEDLPRLARELGRWYRALRTQSRNWSRLALEPDPPAATPAAYTRPATPETASNESPAAGGGPPPHPQPSTPSTTHESTVP